MSSIKKCDGGYRCCAGGSGGIVGANTITADVRNVEDDNTVMDLR